jgi:serine O-acetyltransferase
MRGEARVVQSMNPQTASVVAADEHSVAAVWSALRAGAEYVAVHEPALEAFAQRVVLSQASFTDALARVLAAKLAGPDLGEPELALLATTVLRHEPHLVAYAAHDLAASVERDPAYRDAFTPFAYAKGFHALEWQRIAHVLWCGGREEIATFLEGRANDVFGIDIHPGARVGRGVFIDHGTGIVIGETAVVGDDVSMLHGVTLGGTGKESGDRHPKIGNGVLLGAGATVLGNVRVGAGARVAAGSVVLREVAPHTTVAGVPAHLVGATRGEDPAQSMDQDFTDFQI